MVAIGVWELASQWSDPTPQPQPSTTKAAHDKATTTATTATREGLWTCGHAAHRLFARLSQTHVPVPEHGLLQHLLPLAACTNALASPSRNLHGTSNPAIRDKSCKCSSQQQQQPTLTTSDGKPQPPVRTLVQRPGHRHRHRHGHRHRRHHHHHHHDYVLRPWTPCLPQTSDQPSLVFFACSLPPLHTTGISPRAISIPMHI